MTIAVIRTIISIATAPPTTPPITATSMFGGALYAGNGLPNSHNNVISAIIILIIIGVHVYFNP